MSREIVLSLWLFLPILSWVVVYVGRRLFVFELIVSFLPLLVIFTILYVLIISAVYINVINFSLPLLMILFNLLIIFVVSVSYIRFYDLSIDPVKESYLRILSININPKNQRITEVNNQLAQSNFDLVSFLEFKTVTYEGLKSTLIKLYPYTNYDPKTNKYATIFSKYPLNDIDEEMGFISYEIQVKEKRYNIFSVHATAPTTPNLFKNRNKILSYLRSKLDAQNPQNVIVMVILTPHPGRFIILTSSAD